MNHIFCRVIGTRAKEKKVHEEELKYKSRGRKSKLKNAYEKKLKLKLLFIIIFL